MPALAGLAGYLFSQFDEPPVCIKPVGVRTGEKVFEAPPCMFIDAKKTYLAHLDTSLGPMTILLDPRLAAQSVNNFVFLARQRFFDGTTFHRVENEPDHALVQGGDPTGTGRGGPGYTYAGEEPSPITRYIRGVVAMANNTGSPSSNGSQFFIIVRDYAALGPPDSMPRYTFFGFVADQQSLQTLDRIVAVPVDGIRPVTPVVIQSVTIEERVPTEDGEGG